NWDDVVIENSPVADEYGRQVAGGSRSVRSRWDELRQMGAGARAMLVEAAAKQWGVSASEITTGQSKLMHAASNRQLSYGDVALLASELTPPAVDSITLKTPDEYRLLGKRITGADNEALVTGKPLFGIDVQLPNMLYATYTKCPTIGGRVVKANLDEIEALPGVVSAFILQGTAGVIKYDPSGVSVSPGVAIVAESTWQSFKAKEALQIEWDTSEASSDTWTDYLTSATALSDKEGATTLVEQGDAVRVIDTAATKVSSQYSFGFVSHAQLEPQSCIAHWQENMMEIWSSSQTQSVVRGSVAALLEMPKENIVAHQLRGGGGFGRRLDNDYVREAALIAQRVDAPVKLQWSREDDMAFDRFRIGGFYHMQASVDENDRLNAWSSHSIALSADGKEPNSGAGLRSPFWVSGRAIDFPGAMLEHYKHAQTLLPSKTPTGPWRAPRSNSYAFVEQSFVHELAVAAKRDHLEFLIESMGKPKWHKEGDAGSLNTERAINVIETVAERAGWGENKPEGRALGLSFYFSHAGHVAEVADVSVDKDKRITVHKVWVVADIGQIINLSGAENQCEGGVIDGISTLMGQEITMIDGRIEQSNFHQYPLLRINSRPEIDVHFIDSGYAPTGIGEPAFPPLAAAVCNAIYTATGERIRALPIKNAGYSI
ncbi:MAG: xanthine dehydrogenase family protein molybdopterin-binding subunit, partial [Proteobacteria bacterium]|nr:xanthine dehydrogenase family protein molybdopterin-binding subunit [Pseudomonadota bacterium]